MKTALITGASRGIGAAIATKLGKEGYHLSLCCQNSPDLLNELAKELEQTYHISVMTHVGNVGDYSFVSKMVSDTLAHFGQIDVLINNAGISRVGLLCDMTPEQWNELLQVNLSSVFYTCKEVIPSMVRKKHGAILNISSVWGNIGASCEAAYSATKGGMNSLTQALGKELAPSNIPVNALACGCVDTSMNSCFSTDDLSALADEIPAGHFASPQEVADFAYQILTSPTYLTGQILTFDGGWI